MKLYRIIGILGLAFLAACDPNGDIPGNNEVIIPANQGSLEFRFILPERRLSRWTVRDETCL